MSYHDRMIEATEDYVMAVAEIIKDRNTIERFNSVGAAFEAALDAIISFVFTDSYSEGDDEEILKLQMAMIEIIREHLEGRLNG